MNSMTGFGRGQARDEKIEVTVEVSSLNSRNLEVSFLGPKEWMGLEHIFVRQVRKSLQRGKVRVALQAKSLDCEGPLNWDDSEVSEFLAKLEKLSKTLGVSFDVNPALLFRVVQALSQKTYSLPHWETVKSAVEEALDVALDHLQTMRSQEGKALTEDIRLRSHQLAIWLEEIRTEVPKVVPSYRDLLLQRLGQADLDLDDERVRKEIAIFADRCDIAEEITRMDSHLKQLEACLTEEGAVGRKIDFLIQEINREINTVGSKANYLPITQQVIEFKGELERLREQAQNLE